jgi:hypothetical protein
VREAENCVLSFSCNHRVTFTSSNLISFLPSLPPSNPPTFPPSGVTSADFEDLLYARCLPSLVHLSLGNESESLIYNFNCVGWPAMQALR